MSESQQLDIKKISHKAVIVTEDGKDYLVRREYNTRRFQYFVYVECLSWGMQLWEEPKDWALVWHKVCGSNRIEREDAKMPPAVDTFAREFLEDRSE